MSSAGSVVSRRPRCTAASNASRDQRETAATGSSAAPAVWVRTNASQSPACGAALTVDGDWPRAAAGTTAAISPATTAADHARRCARGSSRLGPQLAEQRLGVRLVDAEVERPGLVHHRAGVRPWPPRRAPRAPRRGARRPAQPGSGRRAAPALRGRAWRRGRTRRAPRRGGRGGRHCGRARATRRPRRTATARRRARPRQARRPLRPVPRSLSTCASRMRASTRLASIASAARRSASASSSSRSRSGRPVGVVMPCSRRGARAPGIRTRARSADPEGRSWSRRSRQVASEWRRRTAEPGGRRRSGAGCRGRAGGARPPASRRARCRRSREEAALGPLLEQRADGMEPERREVLRGHGPDAARGDRRWRARSSNVGCACGGRCSGRR